jgi:hypothetical protein
LRCFFLLFFCIEWMDEREEEEDLVSFRFSLSSSDEWFSVNDILSHWPTPPGFIEKHYHDALDASGTPSFASFRPGKLRENSANSPLGITTTTLSASSSIARSPGLATTTSLSPSTPTGTGRGPRSLGWKVGAVSLGDNVAGGAWEAAGIALLFLV